MTLRSSSVSLPHFSLAAPLNCFQLPSTRFQSMSCPPGLRWILTGEQVSRSSYSLGSAGGLGFSAPRRQDEFGVAVRLLPPPEDQIAGGLEGNAVETGRHW